MDDSLTEFISPTMLLLLTYIETERLVDTFGYSDCNINEVLLFEDENDSFSLNDEENPRDSSL